MSDSTLASLSRFLGLIFPGLEHEFIEVRLIGGRFPFAPKFFKSVDSLILELPALKEIPGHNVYFGVCPRRMESGTKEAVSQIHTLWLDLDAKDHKEGKEGILSRLQSFPLKPTAVIDSGNGFHAYWALKEPETNKRLVEDYLKALCQALGGDKSSCEVARILRLPGTFNRKNPSNPLPVNIVQLSPESQHNLSDFDFLLPTAAPIGNGKEFSEGKPIDWIAEALLNLSEGNRNSTFASVIGRLHKERLSASDILALLEPHAERCRFPKDELMQEVEGICKRYPNELISPISLNSHQHSEKKWPAPPKEEAYYGLAGDIVRLIAPHSEADPVALLVQTLGMFGSIIGRSAHFTAEADKHFMNIFSVLVGVTSKGRKGTSFGQIKRLFESVDN